MRGGVASILSSIERHHDEQQMLFNNKLGLFGKLEVGTNSSKKHFLHKWQKVFLQPCLDFKRRWACRETYALNDVYISQKLLLPNIERAPWSKNLSSQCCISPACESAVSRWKYKKFENNDIICIPNQI